jgi:hypothetical protein
MYGRVYGRMYGRLVIEAEKAVVVHVWWSCGGRGVGGGVEAYSCAQIVWGDLSYLCVGICALA